MIYKLFRSNEFDLSFDKNDLANIKTVYGRVGYENRLLKEKGKRPEVNIWFSLC